MIENQKKRPYKTIRKKAVAYETTEKDVIKI